MLALLVVGGLAVVAHTHGTGGVAASKAPAKPTACPNPPESGIIEASYVYGPENLHELKAMSDLVAEVSVVSLVRTKTTMPDIYSVFTARVLTPIAGKHAAGIAGDATIQIRQAGGRVGCIPYTVEGDPMMRPGERDILFLLRYQGNPFYDIVDDTVGRFMVDRNGQIAPNATAPFKLASGTSDTAFIRQIQQA